MAVNPGNVGSGSPTSTFYGNVDVAADGTNLYSFYPTAEAIGQYVVQSGCGWDRAAECWAQQRNQQLIATGAAINTPDGVLMVSNVVQILQQHGYTGPLDANSIATAYQMLRTPSPAAATTAPATSPAIGGALSRIPQPLLIGGGALLVFMLLFRRGGMGAR